MHYHFVVAPNGDIISQTPLEKTPELDKSTTTYVTFESGDLPLLRPLRLLPGGDILADALEPIFTELVNAGYGDGLGEEGNEAIPLDPRVPRPMQPGSSLGNLGDVPGTLQTGLDAGVKDAGLKTAQETAQDDLDAGVKTAQDDVSNRHKRRDQTTRRGRQAASAGVPGACPIQL